MFKHSGLISFLLFILLSLTGNVILGQTLPDEIILSYACKNKPLREVLKDLDQKSKVNINFVERKIPANSKVTISAINQKLSTILVNILKPRKCTYEIIGNQIVVSRVNIRNEDRDLTISGYLRDSISGEELVGANVYLFDRSKGTQTNEYGFYSITLTKGTKRMYYSYLGYGQIVKEIYLQKDTTINVSLKPDVLLNEIIILESMENQEEPEGTSLSRLNLDRIHTSSSLGGEADVIRLVGMMPGVSSGADGLGGINVRGGSADQNLVLLDGVPVYNAGHALGIFSIFNSNIIKNASLIKGNIPARYGGRLSSVLDIRTRDGNTNKFGGDFSLSSLAGKLSLDGPIGNNGSSFLFSARRTFLDPWIKALTKYQNDINGDEGFSTYHFLDINGKINLKMGDKHDLYLSVYGGNDKFDSNKKTIFIDEPLVNTTETGVNWNWGNRLASLKLTSQFSDRTFGRLLAYYTQYKFDSFEYDSYRSEDTSSVRRLYKAGYYESAIQDIGVKYDFDFIVNPTHLLRFGIGAIRHDFTPGLISVNNSDQLFGVNDPLDVNVIRVASVEPQIIGYEFNAYAEDDFHLGGSTILNFGVHTNVTSTSGQTYLSIQPRLSLLAKSEGAFFKAGVSRMNQYMHLLSSNGLGLPTDVWLPSTANIAPEQAWIGTIGVGYYKPNGIRIGIEAYYKLFDNLTSYNEGGLTPINVESNWEELIPKGSGNAYGVEFNFDKIIGRTTWNSNYTFAFAFRDFEDLNSKDKPFPFRYDRRHNIKLGFLHKISDNTEFNLAWNISTGNPITKPSDQVVVIEGPDGPQIQVVYEDKNGGKLPIYNRVDVGFNFYNKYDWGRTKFTLGLYNAFNRNNPFYIDIEPSRENPNVFEEVQFSILPIIPSISYSVSF